MEVERVRHEKELQARLSSERQQADLKLQTTVQRAHQELDYQKSEYENRLEELQAKLVSSKELISL